MALVFSLIALCWTVLPGSLGANDSKTALILEMRGAIGPAVSDYVDRGFKEAEERRSSLIILEMDTPGGLDLAMRDIIKRILASPVPVVTYVAPGGSRAASAGTYILYASHVAAMAPATNLGAATPVQVGGMPGMPDSPADPEGKGKKEKEGGGDTMKRKIINDAEAYIKSLAAKHGRNGEWAARAVRESVSLTAGEALDKGVIDVVAMDMDDLLDQMNGMEVQLESGPTTIASAGIKVERFPPDWRSRLLSVITDPNIAYILLLIGIYGLIFELANPGFVLPGVVGVIAIVLALYTFQVLPINYTGLALIILGLTFMIAEAFVPSFGALGIGGLIAFVFGSVILMDEESLAISLPLIGGTALVSAGFIFWVMGRLYMVSKKKVLTGSEEMIGLTGEALDDFRGGGRIRVRGESWRAACPERVRKGQKVKVVAKEGLILKVETVEEEL